MLARASAGPRFAASQIVILGVQGVATTALVARTLSSVESDGTAKLPAGSFAELCGSTASRVLDLLTAGTSSHTGHELTQLHETAAKTMAIEYTMMNTPCISRVYRIFFCASHRVRSPRQYRSEVATVTLQLAFRPWEQAVPRAATKALVNRIQNCKV